MDDFCSFWRVIERLAASYADKSTWTDKEREESKARKCVEQFTADLFDEETVPEILREDTIGKALRLRNDLSHGNNPITIEVIEQAAAKLKPTEEAAFIVLNELRRRLECSSIQ